jgi:hypothetical protein
MRRKSANNVLTDSTVSNGFPHGGTIRFSIIKLTKYSVPFLPPYHHWLPGCLFLERKRQVKEHKTGSPVPHRNVRRSSSIPLSSYENTAFSKEPSVALLLWNTRIRQYMRMVTKGHFGSPFARPFKSKTVKERHLPNREIPFIALGRGRKAKQSPYRQLVK